MEGAVYDVEWLNKALSKINELYSTNGTQIKVCNGLGTGYWLDPKTSADIILRALAKELNGDWAWSYEKDQSQYWCISFNKNKHLTVSCVANWWADYGQVKFKDGVTAQKAMDILNKIEPNILKNYFA